MLEPMVFTPADVRKLLRLSRSTVYARIADGSIRSIKIGRRILISKQSIDELVAGTDFKDGPKQAR